MPADGLLREDVIESILSAQFLRVKNSISPWRKGRREQLYIIDSFNFEGVAIYAKGVIREISQHESEFFIIISGKLLARILLIRATNTALSAQAPTSTSAEKPSP